MPYFRHLVSVGCDTDLAHRFSPFRVLLAIRSFGIARTPRDELAAFVFLRAASDFFITAKTGAPS